MVDVVEGASLPQVNEGGSDLISRSIQPVPQFHLILQPPLTRQLPRSATPVAGIQGTDVKSAPRPLSAPSTGPARSHVPQDVPSCDQRDASCPLAGLAFLLESGVVRETAADPQDASTAAAGAAREWEEKDQTSRGHDHGQRTE